MMAAMKMMMLAMMMKMAVMTMKMIPQGPSERASRHDNMGGEAAEGGFGGDCSNCRWQRVY